jgi:hypothetical protein
MQLTIDDITAAVKKGGSTKEYKISDINRSYLQAFQIAKYPDIDNNSKQRASWSQYKSTLSNFLEALNKDAAMCKREDIDTFLAPHNSVTRLNKQAHIKAFMVYLVTTNYKNVTSKISRDFLIRLLERDET